MGKHKGYRKGTSSFKGVCWAPKRKAFVAFICLGGGTTALGAFAVEEEAAREYDRAAVAHVRLLLSRIESEDLEPTHRLDALKKLGAFLSRLETNLPLSRDEAGDVERARAVVAAPPVSLVRSLPPSAVAAATAERRVSRFKGVYWAIDSRKWRCYLIPGPGARNVYLSSFPARDELGAARAVDSAVVEQLKLRLEGSSSSSLASSDKREHLNALKWLVSFLKINLPDELTPRQRSIVERAKAAVSAGKVPDAPASRPREAPAGAAEGDDGETDGGRKKKKQRSSPPPPRSASAGAAAAKKTKTTSVAASDAAKTVVAPLSNPAAAPEQQQQQQRRHRGPLLPPRPRASAAAKTKTTTSSAASVAVVPVYTAYDCEGCLQLPDDAAFLFDSASDGFLNRKDAKRSDSVGGSFEQKVVIDGKAFSVVVHRIPKDDVALAASAPGPATAFLTLGGPGWPALSKELGLAPRRSVRFEVEKDFGGGGGDGGLVRASRVS